MARNAIQFQKGLSLTAFVERFGTEEQCRQALAKWRWPDGFVCPHCDGRRHSIVGKRRLYLCHDCRRQTSIKAHTVFAKTLLPLTKWFQAMWFITQSKNSISTLELSRQIGVKWDSAHLMRKKLMDVMAEREQDRKLDGRVEMDDAVIGGVLDELSGGKRGRGGRNKTPFVAAVATNDDGHPTKILLHVVKSHDSISIAAMAKAHLMPTARIVSDGLGCFRAVTEAGATHEPIIAARAPQQSEKIPAFRWVNTILGNLKTAIAGTLKAVRPRYAKLYLAEFQYRFNRRVNLAQMLDRLAYIAVNAAARPYKALKAKYEAG